MSQGDALEVYRCRWVRIDRKRAAPAHGAIVESSRRKGAGSSLTAGEALDLAISEALRSGTLPVGGMVCVSVSVVARPEDRQR
jgi:hypothetical protein